MDHSRKIEASGEISLSWFAGYLWAFVGIAAATAVFFVFRKHLDPGQASMLYLPIVIACAVRFGFGPAVASALLSFCCWDYFFLPPYYQLFINSAHDWTLLCVFLVAAITTAHLASRGRDQARKAEAREAETKMLYEASQAVSSEIVAERLLHALVEQVTRICDASRCLVLQCSPDNNDLTVAASASDAALGPMALDRIHEIAKAVIRHNLPIDLDASNDSPSVILRRLNLGEMAGQTEPDLGLYIPLHVHGISLGVLHAGPRRDHKPFSRQEERVTLTLANHAAVVIARRNMEEDARQQARQSAVLEERTRLAEEVHDTLSHAFTGIKFLLEAVDRVGPTPQAMECVAQARALAIQGAQEARRSVWALRPGGLEEAGSLVAAIRNLALRQTSDAGTVVEATLEGTPVALEPDVEENLYRICQEALTNVYRHAGATKAAVKLTYTPGEVILSVRDDGRGIHRDAPPNGSGGHRDGAPGGGYGMTTMADRSARIGGAISIDSTPDEGTTVTVRAPISNKI